jgi:hypothetical protein
MRKLIDPGGIIVVPNYMVFVTADNVILALEQRYKPLRVFRISYRWCENVTTPPPRFLPIDRCAASQKDSQLSMDFSEPDVFGAGINFLILRSGIRGVSLISSLWDILGV